MINLSNFMLNKQIAKGNVKLSPNNLKLIFLVICGS